MLHLATMILKKINGFQEKKKILSICFILIGIAYGHTCSCVLALHCWIKIKMPFCACVCVCVCVCESGGGGGGDREVVCVHLVSGCLCDGLFFKYKIKIVNGIKRFLRIGLPFFLSFSFLLSLSFFVFLFLSFSFSSLLFFFAIWIILLNIFFLFSIFFSLPCFLSFCSFSFVCNFYRLYFSYIIIWRILFISNIFYVHYYIPFVYLKLYLILIKKIVKSISLNIFRSLLMLHH